MSFDRALAIVKGVEGGYSDRSLADDPGGKTMYGVTEAVARKHGYTGEMRDLPLELAKQIYRVDYWEPAGCDKLPWPLCLHVFDFAVNSGAVRAVRTLQETLRLPVDGVMGPKTAAAAARMTKDQIALYLADRALYMASLGNFDANKRGWYKRLFLNTMEL